MALHWFVPFSCLIVVDRISHAVSASIMVYIHVYKLFRFCNRSLLRDSMEHNLIDQIPGRQNDRKTLLGELNWIFTAITDTIAWNVLPHGTDSRFSYN